MRRAGGHALFVLAVASGLLVHCTLVTGASDLTEVSCVDDCGADASPGSAGDGAPGPPPGDATMDVAQDSTDGSPLDVSPPPADAACSENVQVDPKNCGSCAHDCLGGACQGGLCQPVMLAALQSNPAGIAVAGSNVFFTNDANPGSVVQVPVSGGAPLVLASSQPQPFAIAILGPLVYFTAFTGGTALESVPIGGGAVNVVHAVSGTGQRFVTTDGVDLFYTNAGTGDVLLIPPSGPYTPFVHGEELPAGIAVDGTTVYWVNAGDGTVVSTSKTPGGPVTVLATVAGGAPRYVTVDAQFVYFTAESAGEVLRVAKTGNPLTPLAQAQISPRGIAVDATWVYWVNAGSGMGSPGALMKAPLAGGAATTLVSGLSSPTGLAADAERLYWTDSGDGTVMWVAK